MNSFSRLIGGLFALVLIIIIGWGIYLGVKHSVYLLEYLDKPTFVILVVSSLIVFIGALMISSAIHKHARLNGRKHGYPGKVELYRMFITQLNRSENFSDLNKTMALYGSGSVIKEYLEFLKILNDQSITSPQAQQQFEKVMMEMRKDIGESNLEIKQGDLINLIKNNAL